jgi:hypothetical protein
MSLCRKPYLSDISAEEWSLVAPYLLLPREDAGQREHVLSGNYDERIASIKMSG